MIRSFGYFTISKSDTLTVAVLLILLQCISNGAAVKCFVCDSTVNPGCDDLKSNSSIVAEECTLDKMKSINTWLFELNRFSYFDTGDHRSPLMNCQKVVAKSRTSGKKVTARFCQLDTGDTHACEILRLKLGLPKQETVEQSNTGKNGKQTDGDEKEEDFHCSVCSDDYCNGSESILTGSMLQFTCLAIVGTILRRFFSAW